MASLPKGFRVLVTRPEHQARNLCSLIEQAGGKAILFPTLKITYLNSEPHLTPILQQIKQASFIIFLSANAVFAVAQSIKNYWLNRSTHIKIIAIGNGTRKALLTNNLPADIVPDTQASSEGLLALSELQQLQNKTIIIFKGEGGRGILTPSLAQRGANVIEAIVYRRECPSLDITSQHMVWQQQQIDAIVITSGESLENLLKIIPDKQWLCSITFVVISQRIAELAKRLGMAKCVVAANASDEAILEALRFKISSSLEG